MRPTIHPRGSRELLDTNSRGRRLGAVLVVFSFIVLLAASARGDGPLPGTAPLTLEGDAAAQMVSGIDRFLLRETTAAAARRETPPADPQQREQWLASRRARLAKIIGAVDPREPFDAPQLVATTRQPARVGHAEAFDVYAVRWPVMGSVQGEGLLLQPARGDKAGAVANIVALPDADQTPEMIAGLAPGVAPESQFARRLAESGCRVIIPMLVDRSDTFSMPPSGQRTNQPHREYVYRPAFEMGRHVIGYEVQKVLAAVDWFAREPGGRRARIGVIGYGEGGLLAFYAAAIDPRIQSACVSGYFGPREGLWREPIYRNVFALLNGFGDADVAGLVAPRKLVIEACLGPEVSGPPPQRDGRRGAAPGRLVSPALADVRAEVARASQPGSIDLQVSGDDGRGPFGTPAALRGFLAGLGVEGELAPPGSPPENLHRDFDPAERLKRQIEQMQEFTQSLVRGSEAVRERFWAKADRGSPEKWEQSVASYRDYFANEIVGRFDQKLLPPNARTRQIYDEPKFTGYEVMLDVYPDVFAYGILLVPKDLKPGERRPVVVCQHGLEGRPADVADPRQDNHAYHRFAAQLADQGFITYAPQNPYIGGDGFRVLQRIAQPLGKTLFAVIVPQHQQTTDWLASLPFVDPDRVAFYGLSYGGKTAMRVPALVDRYCLSICSGDFNEWVWKTTSLTYKAGYPGMNEYDMFEWDLGETFNYAEMAGLIAPRPFMVERGHRDGVGIDEQVAYEYAKVRRLYADLKIPARTTIEFFDGPHTIHGVGTFAFLHEQLHWPPVSGK